MLGNDISNDSPSLVMVHVDVFAPYKSEEEKAFLGMVRRVKRERKVNIRTANALYRNSQTFRGVTLECFATDGIGGVEGEMEKAEEFLDSKLINPFRNFTTYNSVKEVVDLMAYLPRLLGVVDVDERAMRYGSKSMSVARLMGAGFGG